MDVRSTAGVTSSVFEVHVQRWHRRRRLVQELHKESERPPHLSHLQFVIALHCRRPWNTVVGAIFVSSPFQRTLDNVGEVSISLDIDPS